MPRMSIGGFYRATDGRNSPHPYPVQGVRMENDAAPPTTGSAALAKLTGGCCSDSSVAQG